MATASLTNHYLSFVVDSYALGVIKSNNGVLHSSDVTGSVHGSPLLLKACRMAVDVYPTVPTSRPLPVVWRLEGSGEPGVDTLAR